MGSFHAACVGIAIAGIAGGLAVAPGCSGDPSFVPEASGGAGGGAAGAGGSSSGDIDWLAIVEERVLTDIDGPPG